MKPVVTFLVNGEPESAMGIRARSFAERLCGYFTIHIEYRHGSKLISIARFFMSLVRTRPEICYVFDIAYSGVIAGLIYRLLSRNQLIVDTGDAIHELAKAIGRSRIGTGLTAALEQAALRWSDRIVVRSHFHQEWLSSRGIRAEVIPDGVDTRQFRAVCNPALRRRYELEGYVTIGMLGSLTLNTKTGHCYGLEIVQALSTLKKDNVKGIIIGDGSGRPELERCAEALGVSDRVVFLGRIPYDDLPQYISLIDICVSTQTDDLPGRVRTTGKLPLYLATGRFVLATNVGEAARVLPSEMLLPYNGSFDPEFPERLSQTVAKHLQPVTRRNDSSLIARKHFDYDFLAQQLRQLLDNVIYRRAIVPDAYPDVVK